MNEKPKHKLNLRTRIRLLFLVCCTIIAGYGIVKAPESDRQEMEQGLRQNEEALKKAKVTAAIQSTPQSSGQNMVNSSSPTAEPTAAREEEMISVIGDSVFLGASAAFQNLYPNVYIDAKISRQVRHALPIAKKMNKKKQLGNIVIISLGTNGNFSEATGQELVDYLGTDRTIYWINAYGKHQKEYKEANRSIQNMADKNSNVHLIYWSKEGKKHPDWFYQDGTHLNVKGQEGFAKYIKKELEEKKR